MGLETAGVDREHVVDRVRPRGIPRAALIVVGWWWLGLSAAVWLENGNCQERVAVAVGVHMPPSGHALPVAVATAGVLSPALLGRYIRLC